MVTRQRNAGFLLAAALFSAGLPALARAQYPYSQYPYNNRPGVNPNTRPAVSPFLNLVRPGTNPAVNYYDLVRPQVEFRSGLLQLQQQTNQIATYSGLEENATITSTGHPTQFVNYLHYYGYSGSNVGRYPGGVATTTQNRTPPTTSYTRPPTTTTSTSRLPVRQP